MRILGTGGDPETSQEEKRISSLQTVKKQNLLQEQDLEGEETRLAQFLETQIAETESCK